MRGDGWGEALLRESLRPKDGVRERIEEVKVHRKHSLYRDARRGGGGQQGWGGHSGRRVKSSQVESSGVKCSQGRASQVKSRTGRAFRQEICRRVTTNDMEEGWAAVRK